MTTRNDSWLNSHSRAIMEVWRANMDIQLILDAGKVAEYMTKYVTKPESDMPISFRNMIRYIMQNQLANGNNVQSTMRIAMSKLFGERMLSRQETSHLIFSLPMVSSSHNFVRVNTKNESRLIASTRNNTSPDPLKTLIDLYCVRTDSSNWFNIDIFKQHENNLLQMPLCDFCKAFMVGVRGVRRNKITTHSKKIMLLSFIPNILPNLSLRNMLNTAGQISSNIGLGLVLFLLLGVTRMFQMMTS